MRYANPNNNLRHFEYYSLKQNYLPIERGIKELIQIYDARYTEQNYTYIQFPEIVQVIDLDARSSFAKGLLSSIIKCYTKFNLYSTKDKVINDNIVMQICS